MALQKLGPFELIRVVGRGGMGTVYEAREIATGDRVAVKALSPAYSFDEHFRNRFEAEIDALMTLDHENIVRLLSYGQDEGNLFFAMELVDGTSLFQEQKNGQVFHWQEIIDIGIQVCEGLRHAHDRGIIHRDMKPGNLMITSDRQVKITDFGIAKSFGSSSLTSEGNVLGTMDFMAPEQARGKNTNARSDLFSLGAVMYSLLSGQPPFLRDTIEQTFDALLSAAPPDRLDKIAPDIPKPLAHLIHRMMEKDPQHRIATAQATSRQLAHVRDQVMSTPKMDTQVVHPDGEFDSASTRVVTGNSTGVRIFGETSERKDNLNQPTSADGRVESNAMVETDDIQARQPDYYNEVTPQQRQKRNDPIVIEETPTSIWPVLLALLAVLGIAGTGVWFSLFRQPTEEDLLSEIRKGENNPVRIQDEISQFVELYPESEEIGYVTGMFDRVMVQKYAKTLRARKNLSTNQPLTQGESKFLEIYDSARPETYPEAFKNLESFLSFYEHSEGLTSADNRAVEIARQIKPYWEAAAKKRIEEGRRRILDALQRGRKSGNIADAKSKFKSVIDMYGTDYWAEDLIKIAREELDKLNKREQD